MFSSRRLKNIQCTKIVFLLPCFLIIIFMMTSLAGCSPASNDARVEKQEESKTVDIVYVEWDSEIASAHVVEAVIEEKLGYNCELLPVTLTSLYESLAAGDQDGTVAAWLPLHEDEFEPYKDQVENLGPNLEGTRIGLAVPDYVPLESIEELDEHAEKFDEKIIGIEPDAGIMDKTEQALDEYDIHNLDLISGSDSTMTSTLENAIGEERWIVITGWTPHWKFQRWDLKYLEDPQNIYGNEEHINTIVRTGLKEDMPRVYDFLDNFYWTPSDMEQSMLLIQEENAKPEEAAKRWIEKNEDLVEEWING